MPYSKEQDNRPFTVVDNITIFWIDDRNIPGILQRELVTAVSRVLYTLHSNDFDNYINHKMAQFPSGTLASFLINNRLIDRLLSINLPHIVGIYGIGNKYLLRWKNTKVRCVFHNDDVKEIANTLKKDFEDFFQEQWSIGVSSFQMNTEVQRSMSELSHENAQFMWYQLLIQILVQMPPNAISKYDMLRESFLTYKTKGITDEGSYRRDLSEFMRLYTPENAVRWYTRDSFAYRLLNEACRTSNIDLMFSFRFLIRDIFLQLQKLYKQQEDFFVPITVYRATTVSQAELEMLKRNVGNLISRHQFLSTSMDEHVAEAYADDSTVKVDGTLSILEKIHIDPDQCTKTPFADIHEVSQIRQEEEILLSIGSVFRVKSVYQHQSISKYLWVVELDLIDNQSMTEELHRYLALNIGEEPNILTLSNFLIWMGQYSKAHRYGEIFLTQLPDKDSKRSIIYNNNAYVLQKMGQFDEALEYANKAIEILESVPNDKLNIDISCAYNDRGLIHKCRGEYADALIDINKALEMRQDKEVLNDKERHLLGVYRSHAHENLGILYKDNAEYQLALYHLQETLQLRQKYLPNNHYWISQTFNNLCLVYTATSNFRMATTCIERAIEIQLQSLPAKHSNLAAMYQTKSDLHFKLGQYDDALRNLQKAYQMYLLIPDCDPLAKVAALSNIGSILNVMGNYNAALANFEEAYKQQQQYAPKHPNIIKNLNNLAMVSSNMGRLDTFMNYSKEALRLCKTLVSEHHEYTAITYLIYASKLNVDYYVEAMDCFRRVLNIYIEHLRNPYHNNVINCYHKMGVLEKNRNQYELAHHYFSKAVETFNRSSLPKEHPLITRIYIDMGSTYVEQNEIKEALRAYETAKIHARPDSPELPVILREIETLTQRL